MPQLDAHATELNSASALQLLLYASAALRDRQSVPQVLSSILSLSGHLVAADAYAVWRTYDGGRIWSALATEGLSSDYRTQLQGNDAWSPTRQPIAIPDVASHPLVEQQQATYQREGVKSLLIMPMWIDAQPVGTITFYYRQRRDFSQQVLDHATALANFASVALQTSEMYEENQREKRRLAFLSEASAVLASSLDYELTLDRVAHLAVPFIANWCTMHIVEGESLTRITAAHADPAQLALADAFVARYPEQVSPDRGVGKVLRTGESILLPHIPEEMFIEAARDEEHLQLMRNLQMTSAIIVPLKSRDRILGALRLVATGRSFNHDDLQLAQALASRAAVAIDNARLYREMLYNEKQLRLSHAAAKMGSWSWDLLNQRIYWSEEFKAVHGLNPETPATFERGSGLVYPEDRAQVLRDLEAVLASDQEELEFEHRSIAGDGRILWIHSRGQITRDAHGKAIALHGIAMDVTERRQTEEALRRTEKLAAAGRLAATVAHETNNPLEAVTNLVYLARHSADLPHQAERHLAMAEEELKRVAQIVRQTLGFYRESVSAAPAEVGAIVSEVLEIYRRRLDGKKIKLTTSIDHHLPATVVAGEIKQVLANLVGNAMDATSEGESIHVSAKSEPGNIQIAISDSGEGISEEAAKRLFEPFFTTKKDVGTGLGLWVSRGIIEKHGGTISFASKPGNTTFTVRIPTEASAETT